METPDYQMPEIPCLPPIPQDAHKYSRGSLLILAGSKRYPGAGVLATLAAEKGGAGYITLATPQTAANVARQHLLCSPVLEAHEAKVHGSFSAESLDDIWTSLHHIDAVCCGPGLTINDDTAAFVRGVLQHCSKKDIPLLLDADALNLVAAEPALIQSRSVALEATADLDEVQLKRHNPLILTPHAGELKRLLAVYSLPHPFASDKQTAYEEGAEQHVRDVIALSHTLDAVVVAKGPVTAIAYRDTWVTSNEATPALARAGTGDVLAGIISSLLAQGMSAFDAAFLGVKIHSKAGVLAEEAQGRRSVTALDVISALPQALQAFEV